MNWWLTRYFAFVAWNRQIRQNDATARAGSDPALQNTDPAEILSSKQNVSINYLTSNHDLSIYWWIATSNLVSCIALNCWLVT